MKMKSIALVIAALSGVSISSTDSVHAGGSPRCTFTPSTIAATYNVQDDAVDPVSESITLDASGLTTDDWTFIRAIVDGAPMGEFYIPSNGGNWNSSTDEIPLINYLDELVQGLGLDLSAIDEVEVELGFNADNTTYAPLCKLTVTYTIVQSGGGFCSTCFEGVLRERELNELPNTR
jgi:hypothetical protein